jgi:GNAT superfamily N-acetyltransferase
VLWVPVYTGISFFTYLALGRDGVIIFVSFDMLTLFHFLILSVGDYIGVHSSLRTKGIASAFLQWICHQADETLLEIYLTATQKGAPLYKQFGFQNAQPIPCPDRPITYGKYVVMSMVRPPKRLKLRSLL